MLTPKQLDTIRNYEQELRGRYDRLTQLLAQSGYVDGEPVEDRGLEVEDTDSDGIAIDMVPVFLKDRAKIAAALINQSTLLASYVRELLTYESFCLDTLADPERSEEHAQRWSELEQLHRELPDWKKGFWFLTGKSIGRPNSREEVRDQQGRTKWVYEYDENGYEASVLHFEYEDESELDLDIDDEKPQKV